VKPARTSRTRAGTAKAANPARSGTRQTSSRKTAPAKATGRKAAAKDDDDFLF